MANSRVCGLVPARSDGRLAAIWIRGDASDPGVLRVDLGKFVQGLEASTFVEIHFRPVFSKTCDVDGANSASAAGELQSIRIESASANTRDVFVQTVHCEPQQLQPGFGIDLCAGDRVFFDVGRVPCFVVAIRELGEHEAVAKLDLALSSFGRASQPIHGLIDNEGWYLVSELSCIELPADGTSVKLGRASLGLPDTRLSRDHVSARLVDNPDPSGSGPKRFVQVTALGRKGCAVIAGPDRLQPPAAPGAPPLVGMTPVAAKSSTLLAPFERLALLPSGDHVFVVSRDMAARPANETIQVDDPGVYRGWIEHQKFNYNNPKKRGNENWMRYFAVRHKTYIALYVDASMRPETLRQTLMLDDTMLIKADVRQNGRDHVLKVVHKNPHGQTLAQFIAVETSAQRDEWIEVLRQDRLPRTSLAAGKMNLTLGSARGIRAANVGGKSSDPYIIISIDGYTNYRKKTATVMKTLNPVWNESVIIYPKMDDTVRLILWDYDVVTKNTQIGEISFLARNYAGRGVVRETLPWGGKKGKGTLSFAISFGEPPPTVYKRADAAPAPYDVAATATAELAQAPLPPPLFLSDEQQQSLDTVTAELDASQYTGAETNVVAAGAEETVNGEARLIESAMRMFRQFDTDDSQTLDHVQFGNVLAAVGRHFGIPPPTRAQVSEALSSIDANGDGVIDEDEFLAWYRSNLADQLDADSDSE